MASESERGTRSSGVSLCDTIAAPIGSASLGHSIDAANRSTVLPRVEHVAGKPTVVVEHLPRYEDLQVLGRGGVGVVELARDNDIGRNVAVKRLLPEATKPADLLRFAEEVRTVGLLEHPNITPIHDVGVDDRGRYFFVMKHVEGHTLEHIIAGLAAGDADLHARFTFEARTRILLGILQALAYAHGKGVLHRDIKPANIMVGPCGEVVVMDWGLAARGDLVAEGDALVGTPAYMAPEQALGGAVDARTDVYAASVVFYELLTLRHYLPSRAGVLATLASIETHEPTPARFVPSPHQSNVPPELSWFVAKGMHKDPAERYQTMAEMIDALTAIRRGDIPAQCPRTLLKRLVYRAMRFSDAYAAASLVATALVLAVFVWGLASAARSLMAMLG